MRSHWTPSSLGLIALALASASCTSPARPTLTETTLASTTVPESTIAGSSLDLVTVDPLRGSIQYTVVATYPHDPSAFTQGLEFVGEKLYESTGRRGVSDRRIVDPATGEVLVEVPLDESLFGEGMTERGGRLYQLTFTSGLLLISDTETLTQVAAPRTYDGEGWGLCVADSEPGSPFVMSNGTAELTIRDPESFDIERTVAVVDDVGEPVPLLNELECMGDWLLANVWRSDEIVAIDLSTGQVIGRLVLSDLVPSGLSDNGAVLNGIAYRPRTDTYFVTGKLWPVTYELRLSSS